MDVITERIDANPEAEYLIDFIPNLKYMLRAKFLQENITAALLKFEEKVWRTYPIYSICSLYSWLLFVLCLISVFLYTSTKGNIICS